MKQWFKSIEDLKGLYLTSNLGNIYSTKTKKTLRMAKSKGYNYITIYTHLGQKTFALHRLVAKAFISRIEGKDCVNHINEIKTDNRSSNLEWCTHNENMNHGTRNKRLSIKSEKIKVARCDIDSEEVLEIYESTKEAARNGFTRESVSRAARGIYANHKGFKWKFV